MDFKEILEKIDELDLMVIPYENATGYGIRAMVNSIEDKDSIKNVGIMVGPEGGFEESEIEALKEKGAHIVTLGPRILRTETAGFTCISLIQYELGDLGGNI